MKKKLLLFGIALLAFNLLSINYSQAQENKLTQGLSVKLGGGLTTFYGELSGAGTSVLKNVKGGFSGSIIKMINPIFGIQAQYTGGNLYSTRTDVSQYFNGFVNEIGLSARLELLPLIAKSSTSRIAPYIRAGIASTSFRTVRRDIATNTIYLPAYGFDNDGLTKIAQANALAIPLAAGIAVNLTENIALEFEQSLSITNSDILDALPGTSKANDMFGFSQLGLKYTINPFPKDPLEIDSGKTKKPARTRTKTNKNKNRKTDNQGTDLLTYAETNAFIESTIPDKPISGKVFEVQIRINKGDYEGPGILTQAYPQGFTAIESILGTSQFSFVNQKVRVIWDQMPKDSIITYSYMVRPSENTRGSYSVPGDFEYRQSTGPQVIHFANYIDVSNRIESGMDSKILGILDNDDKTKTQTGNQENIVQKKEGDLNLEELLREYGGKTQKTEEDLLVDAGGNVAGDIEVHKAKQGAEFRIQIGAFKNQAQGQAIVRRYSLKETVIEEYHNNLYKYTLGSFSSYKDAADYRNEFTKRSGIWSAFIVGYKDGIRLSDINDAIK